MPVSPISPLGRGTSPTRETFTPPGSPPRWLVELAQEESQPRVPPLVGPPILERVATQPEVPETRGTPPVPTPKAPTLVEGWEPPSLEVEPPPLTIIDTLQAWGRGAEVRGGLSVLGKSPASDAEAPSVVLGQGAIRNGGLSNDGKSPVQDIEPPTGQGAVGNGGFSSHGKSPVQDAGPPVGILLQGATSIGGLSREGKAPDQDTPAPEIGDGKGLV